MHVVIRHYFMDRLDLTKKVCTHHSEITTGISDVKFCTGEKFLCCCYTLTEAVFYDVNTFVLLTSMLKYLNSVIYLKGRNLEAIRLISNATLRNKASNINRRP